MIDFLLGGVGALVIMFVIAAYYLNKNGDDENEHH